MHWATIEQRIGYISYAENIRQGILEANNQQRIAQNEFDELINPVLGRLAAANRTLRVLKRQRQAITDDLVEETASTRQRLTEPSDQCLLLERAYANTILSRMMSACAKQSALNFNQKRTA